MSYDALTLKLGGETAALALEIQGLEMSFAAAVIRGATEEIERIREEIKTRTDRKLDAMQENMVRSMSNIRKDLGS